MKSQNEIQRIATEVAAQLSATAAKTAVNLASVANPDHDTITTLVNSVNNLDAKFTEKFAEIRVDIKELKDGTSTKISTLESKVAKNTDDITKLWSYGTAFIFIIGLAQFFLGKLWR